VDSVAFGAGVEVVVLVAFADAFLVAAKDGVAIMMRAARVAIDFIS